MGKIVTIIYGVPAIAFCMTLYIYSGNIVKSLVTLALIITHKRLFDTPKVHKLKIKVLIGEMVTSVVLLMLFAFPSNMATPEPLDYLDSIYFAFATITTIGFGDYSYNSEVVSRNFIWFLAHALMFCFATGSITSIVTSLNGIFTEKTEEQQREGSKKLKHRRTWKESESYDGENRHTDTDYGNKKKSNGKGSKTGGGNDKSPSGTKELLHNNQYFFPEKKKLSRSKSLPTRTKGNTLRDLTCIKHIKPSNAENNFKYSGDNETRHQSTQTENFTEYTPITCVGIENENFSPFKAR